MHKPSRRSRFTAAIAIPLIVGSVIAAAPASAVIAGPVLTVNPKTTTEGTEFIVPVRANCVFSKCKYVVTTTAGSAVDGSDYTSVTRKKTIKKNKKLKLNIRIPTTDDAACEQPETFTVRLTGPAGNGNLTVADGVQTINDNDCQIVPPPGPTPPAPIPPQQPLPNPPVPGGGGGGGGGGTPPPALPADSGSPAVTNQNYGDTIIQECRTPYWIGTEVANGFYNSGCTATAKCPITALTCQSSTESGINLETRNGANVSLNSRLRVFSASLTEFFHRDVTCAITDWCRTEDMVMIRGGETATNQCNGVRAAGKNRAQVYCSIKVEKVT